MEFFTTMTIGGGLAFVGAVSAVLTFAIFITKTLVQHFSGKKEEEKDSIKEIKTELNDKIITGDRELREEIKRLNERVEKIYDKLIEWMAEK